MLKNLGGGYTLAMLDDLEFYDYSLIYACISADTTAKTPNAGHGKLQEEVQFTTEADYSFV